MTIHIKHSGRYQTTKDLPNVSNYWAIWIYVSSFGWYLYADNERGIVV